MKKMWCFMLLSTMVLLFGCTPSISSGTIIEKEYEPAESQTNTTMVMSGKTMIPMTTTNHYPEEWLIVIEGKNEEGETDTREIEVSKKEYKRLNIGDYYTVKP